MSHGIKYVFLWFSYIIDPTCSFSSFSVIWNQGRDLMYPLHPFLRQLLLLLGSQRPVKSLLCLPGTILKKIWLSTCILKLFNLDMHEIILKIDFIVIEMPPTFTVIVYVEITSCLIFKYKCYTNSLFSKN